MIVVSQWCFSFAPERKKKRDCFRISSAETFNKSGCDTEENNSASRWAKEEAANREKGIREKQRTNDSRDVPHKKEPSSLRSAVKSGEERNEGHNRPRPSGPLFTDLHAFISEHVGHLEREESEKETKWLYIETTV